MDALASDGLPLLPERLSLNLSDTLRLASRLFDDGAFEEALSLYEKCCEIIGGFEAIHGRAMCLSELGRHYEALPLFDRCFAITRDQMTILCANRARTLSALGRDDEALSQYDALLKNTTGANKILHYNRGLIYTQSCQYEKAVADFDAALVDDPEDNFVRFARGFTLIMAGDFLEGFKDYENRRPRDLIRAMPGKLWTGEDDLNGKTIIIHCEMGFGDNIIFSRFLPMVSALGARVITILPDSQKFLIDHMGPNIEFRTMDRDTWPANDYWTRYMSLAHCLRITLETLPPPLKITHDPMALYRWSNILNRGKAGSLKVGLCWSGSPRNQHDDQRSILLADLARFFDISGITWYNLTKDVRPRDRDALNRFPIVDVSEHFHTFEDLGDCMKCLDLVITVCTSVAHMAGTVNVPTLLMLAKFRNYWCWRPRYNDTPWYSSIVPIWQKEDGIWNDVLDAVVVRLKDKTAAG